jgi:hypothetical protein
MGANFQLYAMSWAVLAGIVLVLALYRNLLSKGHFTVLHVRRSELPMVPGEAAYAERLNRIDRWGKVLTTAVLIYGIALATLFVYTAIQADKA